MTTPSTPQNDIRQIIGAYDTPIIRTYSWGRFKILRQRFLSEIGQYLPPSGHILDLGCGFGLFSLYFAKRYPNLHITGIDLNPNRIHTARKAARTLGLKNVEYEVGDATTFTFRGKFDAAYMLDIIHHIPCQAVPPLIQELYGLLKNDSRLILKDVDTKPTYKRWFTYVLDKLIDRQAEVHYWELEELTKLLSNSGFQVFTHAMVDYLPYPHLLYICQKNLKQDPTNKIPFLEDPKPDRELVSF